MKKSEDWSEKFEFLNAYDVVGAPQNASSSEIERFAEELQSAMRGLGFPQKRRRLLDQSVKTLLDVDLREGHDDRAETQLLASQDPIDHIDTGLEDVGALLPLFFRRKGVQLRDFSDQLGSVKKAHNQRADGDGELGNG